MKLLKPENANERAALDEAMRALREEWGFHQSFNLEMLIGRWTKFIGEVETGYRLTLHDYTQDLALRDSLEDLGRRLPERLRRQLTGLIEPLDQRFRFATRETRSPLLPVDTNAFWWRRLPTNLHGDLLEGALAEHLI